MLAWLEYFKIQLSQLRILILKIPVSKLSSEQLETLFEESQYVEKFFFPPEVPTVPAFKEEEELLVLKTESSIEDE